MMTLSIGREALKTPATVRGREQKTLRAGFIPLMDASILIVAAELALPIRKA